MSINLKHADSLYIDGKWIRPFESQSIDLISPETEKVFFRVAAAGKADMDLAVNAARNAFDNGEWSRMPVAERIATVGRLADALDLRDKELADAWSMQIGGLGVIAGQMAKRGTAAFRDAIEIGRTFDFERQVTSSAAPDAWITHDPVGVVAAIAPWNVPYLLMTRKIAPALIAGCTVIMKPSPETPLEAYIIAECADEVGFPAGVINLVPAGREAADHLMRNVGIDKIAFTGSTAVGRHIAQVCGENIRRFTLELGGKSAAIVLDDYSDEEVARTLTTTITRLSGQVCATLSRAIVPRYRHDDIADAIAAEMRKVRIGYSNDPQAQMGSLAARRQLEQVERFVKIGLEEGATLVTGGKRPSHLEVGSFFEPTLFSNVRNSMAIAQEEIFGPVLCLIPCDDTDDAIRIANDTIYGLNASVLTHDPIAALAVARQIRAGNVGQNGLRTDFALPNGGFKQSGIGREGGVEGLLAYLETKTLLLDHQSL